MKVYLGIGSNIDPQKNIVNTKKALKEQYAAVRFSNVYESKAVGFAGENFLNLVAEIHTELSLEELIQSLKTLEDDLGRVRGGAKFSSRHIDIDILLYGDYFIQSPIKLPRDEINGNAYVLRPLAELAPNLIEPNGWKSYSQLWQEFDHSIQPLKKVDL